MADDITIPVGQGGLLLLIFGWWKHNSRLRENEALVNGLQTKIDNVDRNAGLATAAVAQSQLASDRRFAKDVTVQQRLARIHMRLDETATNDDVPELRDDLHEDIKTPIAKSGT